MNKFGFLKIVNPLLALSFLVQAVTVVFMLLGQGPAWKIKVHVFNGLAFLLLALLHIILNWGWIKANILKSKTATGGTGQ